MDFVRTMSLVKKFVTENVDRLIRFVWKTAVASRLLVAENGA